MFLSMRNSPENLTNYYECANQGTWNSTAQGGYVSQMLVNWFVVCCSISQEGAFALAFKSTKFPGEIVATRFVAVYSSIEWFLKTIHTLPWAAVSWNSEGEGGFLDLNSEGMKGVEAWNSKCMGWGRGGGVQLWISRGDRW